MMYTTFEKLTVKDFGPFCDTHVLQLDSPGLTFIKGRNKVEPRLGSNGAGKSKLLNALCWCLYGKTSDDLGSTDIRPWNTKAQTYVSIELYQDLGQDNVHKHTIERTASPNSLKLNNKPCKQEDIDKILGMSLAVFRLVVFLGQGQPLFHDLANSDKLRFLSDVLNLDQWDTYSDKAKALTEDIDRKLSRYTGQMADSEVRCKELEAQVDRQKQVAAEWEAQLKGKLKELDKIIKQDTKELELIGSNHSNLTLELEKLELRLTESNRDLEDLRTKEGKAALAVNTAKQAKLAAQRDLDKASAQLRGLKESRQCPTCGAAISKQSTYLANVEKIEAQIQEYTKTLHELAVDDLSKKHAAILNNVLKMRTTCTTAQKAVDKQQQDLQLTYRTKIELDVKLRNAQKEYDALEAGENPHRGRLSELRTALKKAVEQDAEISKKYTELNIEYERTKFWVKGFKDIRLFILEDVLQELQFATNNMLAAVGLIDWECTYAVERETKAGTTQRGLITTVTSPTQRSDVKWKAWSGGEGQRLRIAGALALSQVLLARAGTECNLEILDEPTAHLSGEGVEDLCEFLYNRAQDLKRSIYLIDHKAIESTKFTRTLTVQKTSMGSSIKKQLAT